MSNGSGLSLHIHNGKNRNFKLFNNPSLDFARGARLRGGARASPICSYYCSNYRNANKWFGGGVVSKIWLCSVRVQLDCVDFVIGAATLPPPQPSCSWLRSASRVACDYLSTYGSPTLYAVLLAPSSWDIDIRRFVSRN